MPEIEVGDDLIKNCLAGKQNAMRTLYHICFADMYKVSARYGKHPEDIQEIIDNSFLKILKGLETYTNDEKFPQWVRTIAINSALDFVRAKQRKLKIFSDQEFDAAEQTQTVDHREWNTDLEVRDIFKVLQSLPEQYQIILNLFAFEGYSHKEISGMMDISVTTSRWYLSEARKMMKEKLNKTNIYRHERA
ncbi:MAG: RNA polymerase sigma factor [Cryomorphaceae bacterium]|nr:RNA polymerase sigma factor [Cryomorphaceae bacterium]